jgi:hypothetical protein
MPFTAVRLSSGVVPSNSDAVYLSETDSTSFIVIVVVLMTTEEGGRGGQLIKTTFVGWAIHPVYF